MKNLTKNLPEKPGIYKMKNAEGTVIYIGKAKNLKNRVSSYFLKDYQHSTRTRALLKHLADIECTQTDSELEALILEHNLVSQLKPKYNILLKDDKSYLYIMVKQDEDFPRIRVVRQRLVEQEGKPRGRVKYFGPKLESTKVYETLRLLKKLFPYRHCQLDIKWKSQEKNEMLEKSGGRHPEFNSGSKDRVTVTNRVIDFPCLDYYIKRCPGPCIGAISPDEYKKVVQQVIDFLEGKSDDIEHSIKAQMAEAAEKKLFEKAARLRDKLFAIQAITERQKVENIARPDTDVISFVLEHGHVYFTVLQIRNGKLTAQENFLLDALEIQKDDIPIIEEEIFESFLTQFYERAGEVPREIILPNALTNELTLEMWLTRKRGGAVKLIHPQKGEKNHLLQLAQKNAASFAAQHRIKWLSKEQQAGAVKRLASILKLKNPEPKRIEGYDISHLGGNETVGSMVVFENGVAKSSDYRHFKLRTVTGKPDDYQSMYEVLMRRLKYLSSKIFEGIKFGRASKKDFPEIKKTINEEMLATDDLQKAQFLVAKHDKKIISFCRMKLLDPKTPIISSLWVASKVRGNKLGYELMRRLIKKYKIKKVYVDIQKKLEEYYAIFGFIPLKNPPEVLVEHTQGIDSLRKEQGKKNPPQENLMYMVYEASKRKIDASLSARPDLLVIDGGKGQLAEAVSALKELKLDIPVISLAKRLEEIYIPGAAAPILLDETDEALKLLQRIRDESHRFAITFQRKLHRKALISNSFI